jgi:hypothetical protein
LRASGNSNVTPFATAAAAKRHRVSQPFRRLPVTADLFLALISSSTMLLFVAFALAASML